MRTNMASLAGTLLIAATALGAAQQKSITQELQLSDLRAKWPQEAIVASRPCQQARDMLPTVGLVRHNPIDPTTLVADLGTLMEKSEEVILAGSRDSAQLLSPSGESTATYREIRVIHSWKGPHRPGDVLTFGVPGGLVECALPGQNNSFFSVLPGGNDWVDSTSGPYAYVLFLRKPTDNEAQMVQGLLPAAGHGVQGMFLIKVSFPNAERYCAGVLDGKVQPCDAYLQSSQDHVMVPYVRDPLAKRYVGMPASDFLREIQSVAAGQGVAQNSSLR